MNAAAQLLAAVVPIVRTRLPRGVDIDYLDDFVDRNRSNAVTRDRTCRPSMRRAPHYTVTAFDLSVELCSERL